MDDRRRDGGTNSTLRTKEQGTHLTLNEHNDDEEKHPEFYGLFQISCHQKLKLSKKVKSKFYPITYHDGAEEE